MDAKVLISTLRKISKSQALGKFKKRNLYKRYRTLQHYFFHNFNARRFLFIRTATREAVSDIRCSPTSRQITGSSGRLKLLLDLLVGELDKSVVLLSQLRAQNLIVLGANDALLLSQKALAQHADLAHGKDGLVLVDTLGNGKVAMTEQIVSWVGRRVNRTVESHHGVRRRFAAHVFRGRGSHAVVLRRRASWLAKRRSGQLFPALKALDLIPNGTSYFLSGDLGLDFAERTGLFRRSREAERGRRARRTDVDVERPVGAQNPGDEATTLVVVVGRAVDGIELQGTL
jgi:hypothetical protein